MECYDVVVVGAGPAGCALTRLLALSGERVLLIERNSPGLRQVCGGFLGNEVLPVLESLGLQESFEDLPKNEIKQVRVSGMTSRALDCGFKRGPGWAVDRGEFGRWLSDKAIEAGAELMSHGRVIYKKHAGGFWHLELEHGEISRSVATKHLILAHGRRMPRTTDNSKTFFACKTVYEGVKAPSNRVALHFVEKGHVGLNPLNEKISTMCLYVENSHIRSAKGNLDGMMRSFMASNPCLRDEMGGAKRVSEWQVCAAEPDRRKIFFQDGAFFAGDAVTMIDPIVGGGIPIAMAGAGILARLLLEAMSRKNNTETQVARLYENAWRARFNHRARLAAFLGFAERSERMTQILFSLMNLAPGMLHRLVSHTRQDVLHVPTVRRVVPVPV